MLFKSYQENEDKHTHIQKETYKKTRRKQIPRK